MILKKMKKLKAIRFTGCEGESETSNKKERVKSNKERVKYQRRNLKYKTRRNRRKRKNSRNILKSLRFLGVNCAGLRSKLVTFKKVISELDPSVFFVQETKLKEQGRIKLNEYIIFEKLRSTRKNGGGLAIGCKPELSPIWVREGDDDIETLSIDNFVKNIKIRCCTGYGFQENKKKTKQAGLR